MIPTENKKTIHFKKRLLSDCLPHDLETVTANGRETISQYHAPLAVAKLKGKRKKIKSGYFTATPRTHISVELRRYIICLWERDHREVLVPSGPYKIGALQGKYIATTPTKNSSGHLYKQKFIKRV